MLLGMRGGPLRLWNANASRGRDEVLVHAERIVLMHRASRRRLAQYPRRWRATRETLQRCIESRGRKTRASRQVGVGEDLLGGEG